jgi:hypothetical protein
MVRHGLTAWLRVPPGAGCCPSAARRQRPSCAAGGAGISQARGFDGHPGDRIPVETGLWPGSAGWYAHSRAQPRSRAAGAKMGHHRRLTACSNGRSGRVPSLASLDSSCGRSSRGSTGSSPPGTDQVPRWRRPKRPDSSARPLWPIGSIAVRTCRSSRWRGRVRPD